MKEETRVGRSIMKPAFRIILMICGGFILSGCVLTEKYEAEKARSLNFQRLLAQEEKRTGELDNEVKRTKRELAEYETRNRELTAQVQAVREQMARVQEEAEAVKEAALLERKAKADMKRATAPAIKPRPAESTPSISELLGTAPGAQAETQGEAPSETAAVPAPMELQTETRSAQNIHVVKPGETLYRISRRYGVKVDVLRKWNKLPDDIIEVGQKLIVSQEP
ncbi:MAG TPA: LysM peptidoglycan-binding domain-containing protein [Nitrospira sp.]|nr:LysM peptidoglycan-binding domain-containing protein [Nitrospira sp.]